MRQRYESSEDGADTKCPVNTRCCYLRMKARGAMTVVVVGQGGSLRGMDPRGG